MTTYTAIANSAIDQDSPVTQPLMTALRDNPIAITEGASGAPRVQPEAVSLYYGSGSATRSTIGSSTAIEVTDLDNVDYVLLAGDVINRTESATSYATYALSTDNGATYGTEVEFLRVYANNAGYNNVGFAWVVDISSANAIEVRVKSANASSSTVNASVIGLGV